MDKNGCYCILTKGGALSSYVESLAESAATYIPFAESRILWDTYLVSTYLLHGMWIHVYLFVNPWNFLFLSCFFNFYLHFSPSPFNTSQLTDSYILFTLKMESVSKNTIFGLKMMAKSGLEKNILKSLHAGRWLYLLLTVILCTFMK